MTREQLITAFEENQCPFFVVVDHKGFCITKNDKLDDIGEASEKLKRALNNLDDTSKIKYSVYCFEELPSTKLRGEAKNTIKLGEHDYLLQFTPYEKRDVPADEIERKVSRQLEWERWKQAQQDKLDRLEQLILAKQIEDEAEDEEELQEQAQPNILGGLMNNPQIQTVLAGAVAGYLSKLIPSSAPMAMAGVPGTETHHADDDSDIWNSIEILKQYDPELPAHLSKLADMAQNQTSKFKMLISML